MTNYANQGPDASVGYVDSMGLLDDPERLRARGEADGYLFFRGALPAEPLLDLRREMLEVIDRHGLLRGDAELMEGRADIEKVAAEEPYAGCTEGVFLDIQRMESFHRMAHHPALLRIFEALFGTAVLPHPRNIARVLLPGPAAHATPAHQDFIHIQGAVATWTAWFPLGDCPRELGGLSVLERSHKKGVLAVSEAGGAGGLETVLCPGEDRWIEDDFAVGDVLTFPSTTVHKGLPNQLGDRIRLSCDFRYQSVEDEIEQASLLPHRQALTWEEIYAGWERKDLCYYWEKHSMAMSPWDEEVRWQKARICD
ncbi:phytanoyl-CoA dioxygenase family protein [Mucisphaera sp.]|uniref:phytanoyl-CoA dioxygenase family protein n=1 Tax=Mucisphaera sp. TaxID=2913024 RepID=UPI003D0EE8C8